MESRFAQHVEQRTVVLPDARVLFVPVPKAGCTTVLWVLSRLAGIAPETFARSGAAEVSTALTVHDLSLWRPEHRLATYDPEARERMLRDPGWLRFSLVRHPAARLWSGWQSKLLLREPRFVAMFGSRPWFPRVPETAQDMIDDFRAFVAVLGRGEAEDVHWSVQRELVDRIPLTHVGRVERLADTLALLGAHAGGTGRPDDAPRENSSPLTLPAHAFDAAAAATLHRLYRDDFAAYGYTADAPSASDRDWDARAEQALPYLRAMIDERERSGRIHALAAKRAARVPAAERRLEAAATGRVGHARSAVLTNLEGDADFNVRWGWSEGALEPGFTAVLRVKDEARSLPWVLPPLLRAVRRVVLVDNGSTDGTPELARRIADSLGAPDRLEVAHYPFGVARCGSEHLATPAGSLSSLAYFYNWSFAHVRTGYALKWDGDMVLTDAAVAALRDLSWQLEAAEVVVRVPRRPLYVADRRRAFLDTSVRNCEPWGWPNQPGYSFAKALEWELPLWGGDVDTVTLPDWSCVELKHLDADEFGHWSPTDFAASRRTERKRREQAVFDALVGDAPLPDGVLALHSPDERHVVDYVRRDWLPQRQERPAQDLSRASRRASARRRGAAARTVARLRSSAGSPRSA